MRKSVWWDTSDSMKLFTWDYVWGGKLLESPFLHGILSPRGWVPLRAMQNLEGVADAGRLRCRALQLANWLLLWIQGLDKCTQKLQGVVSELSYRAAVALALCRQLRVVLQSFSSFTFPCWEFCTLLRGSHKAVSRTEPFSEPGFRILTKGG